VITGLARFEGRSSLRSWTFSILINRAKTHHAKERRVVASAALTGLESDEPTVDPGRFRGAGDPYPGHWTSAGAPRPWEEPEGGALNSEVAAVIEKAMDRLPERQRLIVQMRDVQGMTSAEACAALQLSEQNQRVLLHRGRAALRSALEEYHRG
jgi:RNA polymerase sigma-70 factor (ECF subfamily)